MASTFEEKTALEAQHEASGSKRDYASFEEALEAFNDHDV